VVSEDVIVNRVILDISMSLDGLIAQSDDDPGPIQEFLFSGETELDGMFRTSGATTEVFREFIDAAGAVITGRRTYDVTNGWEGNHPMRVPCFVVPCFVVTHDVPTDVPDGAMQFNYGTDGIDSAVRQAKAVAGEKDVSIMGGASIAQAGA
jgi:dihydrofolate reductase